MSSIGQQVVSTQISITSAGSQTIGTVPVVNGVVVTASVQNPGTAAARIAETIGVLSGGSLVATLGVFGLGLAASGSFTGQCFKADNLTIPANGTIVSVPTLANIGSMTGQLWIDVIGSNN